MGIKWWHSIFWFIKGNVWPSTLAGTADILFHLSNRMKMAKKTFFFILIWALVLFSLYKLYNYISVLYYLWTSIIKYCSQTSAALSRSSHRLPALFHLSHRWKTTEKPTLCLNMGLVLLCHYIYIYQYSASD